MATIVLYHANCQDGWASAYIAAKCLGLTDDALRPVQYGKHVEPVCQAAADAGRDGSILLLNFSLPEADLLNLAQVVDEVIVLDHHKTAQEALRRLIAPKGPEHNNVWRAAKRIELGLPIDAGLPYVEFDMLESGATMTINFFDCADYKLRRLADYVRDRDLWLWQRHNSRELSAYLATVPYTISAWDALDFSDQGLSQMFAMGKCLLDAQARRVAKAVGNASKCCIPTKAALDMISVGKKDGQFIVLNDDAFLQGLATGAYCDQSEIGEQLSGTASFGLVYSVQNNGDVQCSLRSRGDIDVSEIAKRFGGGGHKNAAGFSIASTGGYNGSGFEKMSNIFGLNEAPNAIRVYGPTYTV